MADHESDFERHLAQAKQRLIDAGECTAQELHAAPPDAVEVASERPEEVFSVAENQPDPENRPGWKKTAARLLVALHIGLAVLELWGALQNIRELEE